MGLGVYWVGGTYSPPAIAKTTRGRSWSAVNEAIPGAEYYGRRVTLSIRAMSAKDAGVGEATNVVASAMTWSTRG